MLPSNKISQNFTYFQIHEDCVAMETDSFIPNKKFSLYLVRKCLGEHCSHVLPSNKISQNFTNFQIHEDCVAMETDSFIPNKEFNISDVLFVYAVLQNHYLAIILCFLLKLC